MFYNLIRPNVWQQLKGNYSLAPLVGLNIFCVTLALASGLRTLVKSPDVIVDRRHNPRPWEKMIREDGSPVQYKFYQKTPFSKNEDSP